jgi:hypothetical protein
MLRLKNLANKYQKRTCRPLYANTQATPYAATLATTFRDTDGSLKLPKSTETTPLGTRTADAYTSKGSLLPGMVAVRVTGTETIGIATGIDVAERPFGLLANFVGGDLDEGFSGDSLQNSVGVWRGPDSVFEILAPAFDDTGLASAVSGATAGTDVLLYAGTDGRLKYIASPNNRLPVARLIERVNSGRIIVDLIA